MESGPVLAGVRLAVIGFGNLGSSILEIFDSQRAALGIADLQIVEKLPEKRELASDRFSCAVCESVSELSVAPEIAIVAIKPQDLGGLKSAWGSQKLQNTTIISVMAGVPSAIISRDLPTSSGIVRCMPNLGIRVQNSMTVYFANAAVPQARLRHAVAVMQLWGEVLEVRDESLLDAATAVSGSGPGFLAYLLEEFAAVAEELGFTKQEALALVVSTFTGTGELMRKLQLSPLQLRTAVTSKDGTTDRGLKELARQNFSEVWSSAIRAAHQRSRELAKSES